MTATSAAGDAPDGGQPRTRWQKTGRWLQQNAGNVVLPAVTVLVTAVAGFFAARYAHGAIVSTAGEVPATPGLRWCSANQYLA